LNNIIRLCEYPLKTVKSKRTKKISAKGKSMVYLEH
jgi:hypothetical protein